MQPDFALSPNTMDTLEQFLTTQPHVALVDGERVMTYDAVKNNNPSQGTIDPSLINEKVTKPSDDENDDAPVYEIVKTGLEAPLSALTTGTSIIPSRLHSLRYPTKIARQGLERFLGQRGRMLDI
jgi:hypothetical protein